MFRPDLETRPVVVLSNNDGCIIAQSDEAKALGVGMAGPYFKARPLIEKFGVATFSSNYNLYGDMSMRVMDTLRELIGPENVEVYSVDECFLDLEKYKGADLNSLALGLKSTVEQWTGIKVSVGIAPTKVLAKMANRLSKKNKVLSRGVMILDGESSIRAALQSTPIGDIWGIGHEYAVKLRGAYGMQTAYDLWNKTEDWASKNLGGVVGVRLLKEIKGEPATVMKKELLTKKMIATTRMFGKAVSDIRDIKEAISSYTSRAAEKLRRQQCAASIISIFVVPREPINSNRFRHGPTLGNYTRLPVATSCTNELIKSAVMLVDDLYQDGMHYKKAGVTLSGIVPDNATQSSMFNPATNVRGQTLMGMIDNLNFSMRNDIIKFAASGTRRDWKMKRNHHSPRYTTRWDELFEVR